MYTEANLGANIQAHDKISSIVKYHDSFFVGLMMDGVLVLERQKDSGEYQIQSLPINSGTFSLIKDRFQDVVWIGTDGQGVYLYSNPLYSIKSVVLNNYTEKIERPVRALLLDKERTFWIGTKGNGILKIFDYEVQKNISDCRSEILTTSNSGLGSNAVYCIRESNRNLLWIGDEEGLNFYSYRERRIKKLPLWIDNEEFKYIHDIYETEDSELWLASVGMGVVRARIGGTPDHPVLENVQRYVVNGGEFGSNYFFTICKGDSLNLLFGNMGYGVYRFNETINGLEPLTTHKYENMNLNKVVPIIKDDADNYLIGAATVSGQSVSANKGLYTFVGKEKLGFTRLEHGTVAGGTFAPGSSVVGSTSSATATVAYVTDGVLECVNVRGTFVPGEEIAASAIKATLQGIARVADVVLTDKASAPTAPDRACRWPDQPDYR